MRATNMQILTNEIQEDHPGVVIYGIGDAAHKLSPSDHNEDDTPGSLAAQQDADNVREHRAIDVMLGTNFSEDDGWHLVGRMLNDPACLARLHLIIYMRKIWRRNGGWILEDYSGIDPHTNHVHLSGEASNDEDGSSWRHVNTPVGRKPTMLYFFCSNTDGFGTDTWAVVTGDGRWVEFDTQADADALAAALGPADGVGRSAKLVSAAVWTSLREKFSA